MEETETAIILTSIKIWYRNFLEAPDTVDMLERLHTRSPEMRQYITEIFT